MRNKLVFKKSYAVYIKPLLFACSYSSNTSITKHFRENETVKQVKIHHNVRKTIFIATFNL